MEHFVVVFQIMSKFWPGLLRYRCMWLGLFLTTSFPKHTYARIALLSYLWEFSILHGGYSLMRCCQINR